MSGERIRVQSFRKWSVTKSDWVVSPRKATSDVVREAKGIALKGTAEDVDAAHVDRFGRYVPPAS